MSTPIKPATSWWRRGIVIAGLVGIGAFVLLQLLANRVAGLSLDFAGYDPTNHLITLCLTNFGSEGITYDADSPLALEQRIGDKWVPLRRTIGPGGVTVTFSLCASESTTLLTKPLDTTNPWRARVNCFKHYGNPPPKWRRQLQPYAAKIGLSLTEKEFAVWSEPVPPNFTNQIFVSKPAQRNE